MFQVNDTVKVKQHGKTVEGTIQSRRTWCDVEPSYCDSQEVNYRPGRMAWGYRVRAPIVSADGTIYKDRDGKPLMGLSYVDEKLIKRPRKPRG